MKVIFRALIIMHITPILYAAQTPDPYAHVEAPIVKRPCSAPPGFMLDACMCMECSKPDADQSHALHPLNIASSGAFRRIQPNLPGHPVNPENPAPEPKSLLPSLPSLKQKSTLPADKLRSMQAFFALKDEETKAEQKKLGTPSTPEKESKEQKSGDGDKVQKLKDKDIKLQAIRDSLVQLASNGHTSKATS